MTGGARRGRVSRMGTPTIIDNATIVTGDEADSIHYDAALVVQDRRIAAIGPTAELLTRYPEAERVLDHLDPVVGAT